MDAGAQNERRLGAHESAPSVPTADSAAPASAAAATVAARTTPPGQGQLGHRRGGAGASEPRVCASPGPEPTAECFADGLVGRGGFPNTVTPVNLRWGLAGWVGDPITPKLLQKIPTTDRIYHSTAAIALQTGCLMICWRWWEFLAHLEPRVQQEVCAVGLINGFALVVDWPEDCELPRQT